MLRLASHSSTLLPLNVEVYDAFFVMHIGAPGGLFWPRMPTPQRKNGRPPKKCVKARNRGPAGGKLARGLYGRAFCVCVSLLKNFFPGNFFRAGRYGGQVWRAGMAGRYWVDGGQSIGQSGHISGRGVSIIIRFFRIGTFLPRAGLFLKKARFEKFFIEKF